jgi:hypothetical protein
MDHIVSHVPSGGGGADVRAGAGRIACTDVGRCAAVSGSWPPSPTVDTLRDMERIFIRLRLRRCLKRSSLLRHGGSPGSWRSMTPPSTGVGCTGPRSHCVSFSTNASSAASLTQPHSHGQWRPGNTSATQSKRPFMGDLLSPLRGTHSNDSLPHSPRDGVRAQDLRHGHRGPCGRLLADDLHQGRNVRHMLQVFQQGNHLRGIGLR